MHDTPSSVDTFITSPHKNPILSLPSPKVDVTAIEPVAAFCSSDEEDDSSTLLYLPISPEIEEPEEGWGPEGAPNEDLNSKRSGDSKENVSPKKKRPKTFDVSLENAPTDGWFCRLFHSLFFPFSSVSLSETETQLTMRTASLFAHINFELYHSNRFLMRSVFTFSLPVENVIY